MSMLGPGVIETTQLRDLLNEVSSDYTTSSTIKGGTDVVKFFLRYFIADTVLEGIKLKDAINIKQLSKTNPQLNQLKPDLPSFANRHLGFSVFYFGSSAAVTASLVALAVFLIKAYILKDDSSIPQAKIAGITFGACTAFKIGLNVFKNTIKLSKDSKTLYPTVKIYK